MSPASIITYAFFMFNTEMHERYLFPYMVFGLPLLLTGRRGILLYSGTSLLFILNFASIVSFSSFDSWILQDEFKESSPVIIATLQCILFFLTWGYIDTYQRTLHRDESLLHTCLRTIRSH
ncbi:MAG: hypothetical protein O3A80_04475 [bacterium]|nr:hypothetical protein [bacterium]